MTIEFKVPELGEGVDSAEVVGILVSEGDTIEADQTVMELETEKAVADLPCPYAGKILKIHVAEGDTIKVGQTVLTIEAEQEEKIIAKTKTEEPSKQEEKLLPAGPATRRLARKLGIDLRNVNGSGATNRITLEDVVQEHDRLLLKEEPGSAPETLLPEVDKLVARREPLNQITRTALKRLSKSWATVPHVTQHDLVDITELEKSRQRYMAEEGRSGPKITLTVIVAKAVALVLKEFPHFNASLDTEKEELILKSYYHIGIAVDTEQGLLVPVLRNVDRKNILDLATELSILTQKAREHKLGMEEMQGGTFTISNQGGIGGIAFTPIVNFPEVAILGISRTRTEIQMIDGQLEPRLMLPLSLSYDHRAINGADAARFLVRLAAELSDSFQLLIRM